MSYFRGEPYIWRDGDGNLHIRSDKRDATEDDGIPLNTRQQVCIDRDTFDQLAVMRVCQLVEEGGLDIAVHNASKSGNGGGLSVRAVGHEILNRLRSLMFKEAA